MKVLLSSVENKTEELKKRSVDLEKNITAVNKQCSCGLTTGANFTNLPDVASELQNVEDVLNQGFVQSAKDVRLSKVPNNSMSVCLFDISLSLCLEI